MITDDDPSVGRTGIEYRPSRPDRLGLENIRHRLPIGVSGIEDWLVDGVADHEKPAPAMPDLERAVAGRMARRRHCDYPRHDLVSLFETTHHRYPLEHTAGIGEVTGERRVFGLGAQLFERINGDYFTILGLPLLPLMAVLRRAGALAE